MFISTLYWISQQININGNRVTNYNFSNKTGNKISNSSGSKFWAWEHILNVHFIINTPGTPVFSHYTSARRRYAPIDKAMPNNNKI